MSENTVGNSDAPQQDVTPAEPVSATPGPVEGDNTVEVHDHSVDSGVLPEDTASVGEEPVQTDNSERKIDGEQDVSQTPDDAA